MSKHTYLNVWVEVSNARGPAYAEQSPRQARHACAYNGKLLEIADQIAMLRRLRTALRVEE